MEWSNHDQLQCEGMIIISLDLDLFEVGSVQDQGLSLFYIDLSLKLIFHFSESAS